MPKLTSRSNNKIEKIFDNLIILIRDRSSFWLSEDSDVKLKDLIAEIRGELDWIENQIELDE